MLFNSLAFAIFLPIVFIFYWALPHKYRYILLFIASYYFYMSWNVKYVVLILFTTFISWIAGLCMEKEAFKNRRFQLLVIVLCTSLGVLFFFKYANFFLGILGKIYEKISIPHTPELLHLILPVGISFYTFQTLSYVIDVYKGKVKPEYNFVRYAAFISFFPQLVAGPIERTENLLPQIEKERVFSYADAAYGLKLMAWGFFKKLVIADTAAIYVNQVYTESHYYTGFALFLATLLFAFQIYCDFSGYSDIAIGTARLFGIELMTNFKSPYFAKSLKEFWGRWHISLSTWFRDYIYIPLGGNRKGKLRTDVNLLFTFIISGFWHGANYTFLVWGFVHGVGQIIEKYIKKLVNKSSSDDNVIGKIINSNMLCRIVTFIFVVFAWTFFRADDMSEAFYIITNMWVGITHPITYIQNGINVFHMTALDIFGLLLPIAILLLYDYTSLKKEPITLISNMPPKAKWTVYYCFILFTLLFASFNSAEFVYFQF